MFNYTFYDLKAMLELKFESENQRTNLGIELVELGIRLGEYTNYKRQGIQFLSPCSASIEMKQSDPKTPALYKASIDSLYFNMTPTLYEVVMGVINTINKSGTEKIKHETQKQKLLEESEPFKRYPVERNSTNSGSKEHDELSVKSDEEYKSVDDAKSVNEESTSAESLNSYQPVLEALDLVINEAFITFCEETGLDLQPLAIVKLQLNGRVANWTKNLHTKALLTLEASYYNDLLSNWEPLIENVMQKEDEYRYRSIIYIFIYKYMNNAYYGKCN
jgi:hypothetical protein